MQITVGAGIGDMRLIDRFCFGSQAEKQEEVFDLPGFFA